MSKPIVIKIGGVAVERQSRAPGLWSALLREHARIGSGGVVLVHGGGALVDQTLHAMGMSSPRHQGLRITPPEQMDVVSGVLAGRVNKAVVGAINAAAAVLRADARAVGLCLGDGGAFDARKLVRQDVDLGRVGEVCGGDGKLIASLLRDGYLPVLSTIGIDAEGMSLNINADDAASRVATVLGARGLVLLTDVAGVLDGEKRVIPTLTAEQIESLIAKGVIAGGMIPKTRGAASVAKALGGPVTILSGDPASLEAFLKGMPTGTSVMP
jgi:acetylglutamate kinase